MDEKALEKIWSQHYSDKGSFENFKLAMDDSAIESIYNNHYSDKGDLESFKLALGSPETEVPGSQEPLEDKGFIENAKDVLIAGTKRAAAGVARIPELLLDDIPDAVISSATDFVLNTADQAGLKEDFLGVGTDQLRQGVESAQNNPISMGNIVERVTDSNETIKSLEEESKNTLQNIRTSEFDGKNTVELLGEKNYAKATESLVYDFLGSAPQLAIMATTGGAGVAAIGLSEAAAATEEFEQEGLSPETAAIAGSLIGVSEFIFEKTGTLPLIKGLKDSILKEGKEQAAKMLKDRIIATAGGALQEGGSEYLTGVTQAIVKDVARDKFAETKEEFVDKYITNTDILSGALVGVATGSALKGATEISDNLNTNRKLRNDITQTNPKLEKDKVKELVELEKQRARLKESDTRTAKNKLTEVENKIDEITGTKDTEPTTKTTETPTKPKDTVKDELVKSGVSYKTANGDVVDLGSFNDGEIVDIQGVDYRFDKDSVTFINPQNTTDKVGVDELAKKSIIPQKKSTTPETTTTIEQSADVGTSLPKTEVTEQGSGVNLEAPTATQKTEQGVSTTEGEKVAQNASTEVVEGDNFSIRNLPRADVEKVYNESTNDTVKGIAKKELDRRDQISIAQNDNADSGVVEGDNRSVEEVTPPNEERGIKHKVINGTTLMSQDDISESCTLCNTLNITNAFDIPTEGTVKGLREVFNSNETASSLDRDDADTRPFTMVMVADYLRGKGFEVVGKKKTTPKKGKIKIEGDLYVNEDFGKVLNSNDWNVLVFSKDRHSVSLIKNEDGSFSYLDSLKDNHKQFNTLEEAISEIGDPSSSGNYMFLNHPTKGSNVNVGNKSKLQDSVGGKETTTTTQNGNADSGDSEKTTTTQTQQDIDAIEQSKDSDIDLVEGEQSLAEGIDKFGFTRDPKTGNKVRGGRKQKGQPSKVAKAMAAIASRMAKIRGKNVEQLLPAIGKATPESLGAVSGDVKNSVEQDIDSPGGITLEQAMQRNNGNPMSKTPDGEESKLYQDILALPEIGGDKAKADKYKAQVYSDNFKGWFGNWQGVDKSDVSKVVDKNGEPLLVYHGTRRDFDTFNTKEGQSLKPYALANPTAGIYTTTSNETAKIYGNPMPLFLNIKQAKYFDAENSRAGGPDLSVRNNSKRGREAIRELIGDDQSIIIKNAVDVQKKGDGNKSVPATENEIERFGGITYIVPNPNQTKSVFNSGQFSKTDDRIKFSSENTTPQTLQDVVSSISDTVSTMRSMLPHIDNMIKLSKNPAEKARYREQKEVIRGFIKEHSNKGKIEAKYSKESTPQYYAAAVSSADATIILALTKAPGPQTFLHELFHASENLFNGTQKQFLVDQYNSWAKANNRPTVDNYTDLRTNKKLGISGEPVVSEWAARAYENYMAADKDVSKMDLAEKMSKEDQSILQSIFDTITEAIKGINDNIKKYLGKDIDITPELQSFFDDISAGRNPLINQTKKDEKVQEQKGQEVPQGRDDGDNNVPQQKVQDEKKVLDPKTPPKKDTIKEDSSDSGEFNSKNVWTKGKLTNEQLNDSLVSLGRFGVTPQKATTTEQLLIKANESGYLSEDLSAERVVRTEILTQDDPKSNQVMEVALMRALATQQTQIDIIQDQIKKASPGDKKGLQDMLDRVIDDYELFIVAHNKVGNVAAVTLAIRNLANLSRLNVDQLLAEMKAKHPSLKDEAFTNYEKVARKIDEKTTQLSTELDKSGKANKLQQEKAAKSAIQDGKSIKQTSSNPIKDFLNYFKGSRIKFSREGSNDTVIEEVIKNYVKEIIDTTNLRDLDAIVNRVIKDYKNIEGANKIPLDKSDVIRALAITTQSKQNINETQKVLSTLKSQANVLKQLQDNVNGIAKDIKQGKKANWGDVKNLQTFKNKVLKLLTSDTTGMTLAEEESIVNSIAKVIDVINTSFQETSPIDVETILGEIESANKLITNAAPMKRATKRLEDLKSGKIVVTVFKKERKLLDSRVYKIKAEINTLRESLKEQEAELAIEAELHDKYGDSKNWRGVSKKTIAYNNQVVRKGFYEFARRYVFGGDFSMALIQGGYSFFSLVGRTPGSIATGNAANVANDWKSLYKAWEAGFQAILAGVKSRGENKQYALGKYEDIMSTDNGILAKQLGLEISKPFSVKTGLTADDVFTQKGLGELRADSALGKKAVSLLDKFDALSEGSYLTMMNILRMDMFNSFRRANPDATMDQLKAYAEFVNNATGTSKVNTGKGLSTVFAAPRLYWSRIKLLGSTPIQLAKLSKDINDPVARSIVKQNGEFIVGQFMIGMVLMSLGFEFDEDPRSKTFLKWRKGDETLDTMAGIGKFVDLGMKTLTYFDEETLGTDIVGKVLGERKYLNKKNSMFGNPMAVALQKMRYSLHPTISAASALVTGENAIGQPFGNTVSQAAWNYFVGSYSPLATQDLIKSDPRLKDEKRLEDVNFIKEAAGTIAKELGIGMVDYQNSLKHLDVEEHLNEIEFNPAKSFTKKQIEGIFPSITESGILNKSKLKSYRSDVLDAVGEDILEDIKDGEKPSEDVIKGYIDKQAEVFADKYEKEYGIDRGESEGRKKRKKRVRRERPTRE